MKTYKYIVNEKKRTVVCLLTVTKKDDGIENTELYRGIAKCNPDDTFDEEAGKTLARRRAILSECEYELNKLDWRWTDEEIEHYLTTVTRAKKCKQYLRRKIHELKGEINKTVRPE